MAIRRQISSWRIEMVLLSFQFALLLALLAPLTTLAQNEADERVAWRYKIQGNTVFIVKSGPSEWRAVRPDDKKATYREVSRNETQILLQNTSSKLFVRLEADFAYWRRPKDEQWTRWVKGQWLAEADIPEAARKTMAGSTLAADPGNPTHMPQPGADATMNGGARGDPGKHEIKLVYFVPRDRQPTREYEQKIRVVMTAVSELIRDDLLSKNYRTAGLAIESQDGEPRIHLVRGEKVASYYNLAPNYDADQQVKRLMPEVRQKLGSPFRNLFVVFAETYDKGPAKVAWPGAIARGAWYSSSGGIAVFSAYVLRDEFCATSIEQQRRMFFDSTPVIGRATWQHLKPNAPRFEFVEDGFGAVAHELGHALGLPHDRRRDDLYIMGNGFRNLRWNFAPRGGGKRVGFSAENACFLMGSRFVNPAGNLNDNSPPEIGLRLGRSDNGRPRITVELSDDVGLRAMLYFDRAAGSVVGGRPLTGTKASFLDPIPVNVISNRKVDLEVFVVDEGGNIARARDELRLIP